MQRIRRRRLLKLSGASTLAAGGGMAGILASGRAPAFARGTALHWLKFVDFVPVSDQLLKGRLKDECHKALGISLTIETINGDGVQARITSAIQAQDRPRHYDGGQQLGAALCREPCRRQRYRRGDR